MKHTTMKEWIPLLVYDELDKDQVYLLEQHLQTCSDCRKELAELKQALSMAGQKPEIDERILADARRELRIQLAIARQSSRRGWFSGWRWGRLAPSLQTAMAGAVCLVLGLGIGYLMYHGGQSKGAATTISSQGSGEILARPVSIGNLRFLDADPSDGRVAFTYEEIEPKRYEGSVNDPRVQEVLSAALTDEQNPGIRLRAADLLGTDHLKTPDPAVKQALIGALKMDENNGVRKQAMTALLNFPFDNDVRDALLFVLNNDPNPAMRIAAIDGIKTERYRDPEVLRVLKDKRRTDGNEYIRLRSNAIYEEVTKR